MTVLLTGGCACENIRYECAEEPIVQLICHCPNLIGALINAQYPSAGGGEATEFRLDDLFTSKERHDKIFCVWTLLHSMSPLMTQLRQRA